MTKPKENTHFVLNTSGHPKGYQYKDENGEHTQVVLYAGPNWITDEELEVIKQSENFDQNEANGYLSLHDRMEDVPDQKWHQLEKKGPRPDLISFLSAKAVEIEEEDPIGSRPATSRDGRRRATRDRVDKIKQKYGVRPE